MELSSMQQGLAQTGTRPTTARWGSELLAVATVAQVLLCF